MIVITKFFYVCSACLVISGPKQTPRRPTRTSPGTTSPMEKPGPAKPSKIHQGLFFEKNKSCNLCLFSMSCYFRVPRVVAVLYSCTVINRDQKSVIKLNKFNNRDRYNQVFLCLFSMSCYFRSETDTESDEEYAYDAGSIPCDDSVSSLIEVRLQMF